MPRLRGFPERINMNVWDAFSPRDLQERTDPPTKSWPTIGPEISLFGSRNIGHHHLTNLCVAGQMASDQTMVIMNWYARTNVMDALDVEDRSPLARAWHAFRHGTMVTLAIGSRPVAQRPLADLMGRRYMFGGDGDRVELSRADQAVRVYDAYREHMTTKVAFPPVPRWDVLSDSERTKWEDVAASIRPFYCPVICPVRQNFSVRIESQRAAVAALLEVMPTNVPPQTLIWVHLDGILSRDVA
jgi:hypothetical protein